MAVVVPPPLPMGAERPSIGSHGAVAASPRRLQSSISDVAIGDRAEPPLHEFLAEVAAVGQATAAAGVLSGQALAECADPRLFSARGPRQSLEVPAGPSKPVPWLRGRMISAPGGRQPLQDFLKRTPQIEPEAEAEVCNQLDCSPRQEGRMTRLEWQEVVLALASVRGDVEQLQGQQGRRSCDLEALRAQFGTLLSVLPRVEASVRHLGMEFQRFERRQAALEARMEAECADRTRAEDLLGDRRGTLEAVLRGCTGSAGVAYRDPEAETVHDFAQYGERLGATESAVECLRQDLQEVQARLREDLRQQAELQGQRHEELSKELLESQKLLREGQEFLREEQKGIAERCGGLEKLGEDSSQRLWSEPGGVAAQDVDSLKEEISSLGAQQELHTLLLESLRRDLEWSEQLRRAPEPNTMGDLVWRSWTT